MKLREENYADIEQAAYEIGKFCKRWGFIQVTQTKEKYGTARVYCSFGIYNIHSMIWPGWVYNQWERRFGKIGKIAFWIDHNIIHNIIFYSKLYIPIGIWQRFIYRLAYKRAMQKFPHIAGPIKYGADYNELLKDLCTKSSLSR